MIEMIKNLFETNDFIENIVESGSLYSPLNSNKESYWFICDEDLDLAIDKQSIYYNACKNIIQKKSFDKNCNMIVLKKINNNEISSGILKKIINVEENPYIFRKYIIYYTEDELKELKSLLSNKELGNFINNNISDSKLFDEYKKKSEFSGYSLLYRIVIKLPFLEIDSSEETLENLRSKIEVEIKKLNLDKNYQGILNFLNNKSLDDLKCEDEKLLFTELKNDLEVFEVDKN